MPTTRVPAVGSIRNQDKTQKCRIVLEKNVLQHPAGLRAGDGLRDIRHV